MFILPSTVEISYVPSSKVELLPVDPPSYNGIKPGFAVLIPLGLVGFILAESLQIAKTNAHDD